MMKTFKQFMVSQEVKGLYRKIFREVIAIKDSDYQIYFRDTARQQFRAHAKEENTQEIRHLLSRGHAQLKEYQQSMKLAT